MRSILMLALVPAVLLGQDTTKSDPRTAQPERPTIATHAYTVARGYLEFETGIERDAAIGSPAVKQDLVTVVTKVGLGSHLQFELTLARIDARLANTSLVSCPSPLACGSLLPPSGMVDPLLSLKWRLTDGHPLLGDFAVQGSLKPDWGADGITSRTTDAGLLLISSRDIGPVHVDLNLGTTAPVTGNGDRGAWDGVWTASFGGKLAGDFGWTAESFGFVHKGAQADVGLLAGPSWTINKSAVLDLGIIRRLGGAQPDAAYLGLTWNAGRIW